MYLSQSLTIGADETITYDYVSGEAGSSNILYDVGVSVALINNGHLRLTSQGSEVIGIYPHALPQSPAPNIENHGDIFVSSVISDAKGLAGDGRNPGFINTGHLSVEAGRIAMGVWDYVPLIDNSGEIRVTGGMFAWGLDVRGGPIQNSGLIMATAKGSGDAIGINFEYYITNARVDNSGTIVAVGSDPAHPSIGIAAYGIGMTSMIVNNSGAITGDYAIKETGSGYADHFVGIEAVNNTGTLNGKIFLGDDNDSLVNSGIVHGDVDLGAQNDLYDGRLGRTDGLVGGGAGDDTLLGGSAFDYLQGNGGADSESGGAGDDWVVGGQGDDTLTGDAGFDVLNGNIGSDSVSGGDGADWIRGGQGDDNIGGGAGDDLIWGDRGSDTMSGGAGADTFGTFAGAGLDRVTDFSLAEGDRVRVEGGVAYTVSTVGGDTVIDLAGGDRVVLAGVQIAASAKDWILLG